MGTRVLSRVVTIASGITMPPTGVTRISTKVTGTLCGRVAYDPIRTMP